MQTYHDYALTNLVIEKIIAHHQASFCFYANLKELQNALSQQKAGSRFVRIISWKIFNPKQDNLNVYTICNYDE